MPARMTNIAALAALLLAALAAPAVAGEPPECRDDFSTQDMLICLGKKLDYQDTRLNRLWKKALAAEDEAGRAMLRKAQRAWIAFRDAQCAYEHGPEPAGSGAVVEETFCLLRMTEERADWLAALTGEGGAADGGGKK